MLIDVQVVQLCEIVVKLGVIAVQIPVNVLDLSRVDHAGAQGALSVLMRALIQAIGGVTRCVDVFFLFSVRFVDQAAAHVEEGHLFWQAEGVLHLIDDFSATSLRVTLHHLLLVRRGDVILLKSVE